MELKRYVRLLRAHWALILAIVVLCAGGAAAYAWTRAPEYAAHTQLFVTTQAAPSNLSPSEIYQGGLASQSRAESYARIVGSPPVAQAVVRDLGLRRSAQYVQSRISATVPEGTVLIDVTVRDRSPRLAKDIADAVARQFPRFVTNLEATPAGQTTPATGPSPVKVTVTSPARLPTSPDEAPKGFLVAFGVLFGLILGIGAAVLRELLDRRVRDDEAAEAVARAPVLGHIPYDSGAKRRPLVVVEDPDSPPAEAYRQLRAHLRFLTIDRDRRTLLITSPVAGEGKTLLSANLAFAFAQAGHRTVLVDADMRRAGVGTLLGLDEGPGLSDVLATGALETLHRERELPLEVLASGPAPHNPAELLESEGFAAVLERLSARAEIVIVDSPAVLPVSDATVMATEIAAVLMVARVSSTRADQLDTAAEALRSVGRQPIGAVLTGMRVRSGPAYGYVAERPVETPARAVPAWDS